MSPPIHLPHHITSLFSRCCIQTFLLRRRKISPNGKVYILGVGPQYNSIVVAARGVHMLTPGLEAKLQAAALKTAQAAKYRFDVAAKATLDFRELP